MDLSEEVAQAIAELRAQLRKTGKVTAIVGTKVSVTVGSGSLDLPRLASYTPTVGDVVHIDATLPGAWLVLGKTA